MNWYLVIKFLHISAVIMAIGGVIARQVVRQQAKMTNEIQLFATFLRAAGKIESVMVIPGMNAVMVLGVILALISHSPILGFLQGASQNWLLVSNILLLGGLITIPTVFIPRGKKFETLLQAALSKGQITSELRAAMNDKAVKIAHLYEEVSFIAIAALMVLKPF
jgi:uncharacterized membrane protein